MDDDHDEHHGLDEASLKEHEEVTKVKVSCFTSLILGIIVVFALENKTQN